MRWRPRIRRMAQVALLVGAAFPAAAFAPETSPRPPAARPQTMAADGEAVGPIGVQDPVAQARPRPRPSRPSYAGPSDAGPADPGPTATAEPVAPGGVALTALRPTARPSGRRGPGDAPPPPVPARRAPGAPGWLAALMPRPSAEATQSVAGSVCGNPAIRGTAIAPIAATADGCGLAEGVQVTAVEGVSLSAPATMDCTTATALADWVREGARPAVGDTGGGLAGLTVAADYVCRPRNNQSGAKISEHGKGRAIDISALTMADGTRISVLEGWGSGAAGAILKAMHESACGPFGTVLGPDSDAFHRDNMHFDTAAYRKGSYCR